jgi:SAM-dependent methyltransferase
VAFAPFHESSELEYSKLEHPWRLPYAEHTFDVAISNGVLEHVPDDVASLRELARVLVPGGILFITCLPNRWSYTEAIQRARGVTSHDRLYTLGAIREMLREAGFATSEPKRFLMVPSLLHGLPDWVREAYNRSGPLVWACNDVLERVWPLGLLASNLSIVAHKHGG